MYSPTLRCKHFPCEMWQLRNVAEELCAVVQDKNWGSISPVELTLSILDNQKGKSQECDLQMGTLNCRNVPYVVYFSYFELKVCWFGFCFVLDFLTSSRRAVDTGVERPKRLSVLS